MSVWLTIPSARPPEEAEPVLRLWRERGYKIALCLDAGDMGGKLCDWKHQRSPYLGYAISTNLLIADVAAAHQEAEWFVTGGDDVEPDLNHSAEEIAKQCSDFFSRCPNCEMPAIERGGCPFCYQCWNNRTFGVMQPTGDRWGENEIHLGKTGSAYIDRVAGSPWIGREFARRMYGGKGPYWPEYTHMGVDEELQEVALKMGVLWQRRDLIHYHRHWARTTGNVASMPNFLRHANSAAEWTRYKTLFAERQAAGFPGHEPTT